MALKKGSAAKAPVDVDEFPEVPDSIPRDRWDRPLITPLDGGKPVAYTRASTLGKAIEDTYHLSKWQQRSVAIGLSRRQDLVALVASIATNEGDDRAPLDELCQKAHEAAKGDKGANVGTALHKLSERRDKGEDLSYLPPILLDAMDAYSAQMKPFTVLASETFVVCDPLQTAGSFDRVVMLRVDLEFRHATKKRVVLPAGTVLVLDLKTGKLESAKYWGAAYGVQQTVYACGQPYELGVGRKEWEDLLGEGLRPSTDWALILHVPSDSPQDAGLVIVDLEAGAAMADLALDVREARKNKTLMSEAYPVPVAAVPTIGEVVQDELNDGAREVLLEIIGHAAHEGDLTLLWDAHQDIWTDEHSAAAKARLHTLSLYDPAAAEPVEPPAQVVKAKLMAALRDAQSEAELNGLWEIHTDVWDADCTTMVKARMREISAVAS